MPRELHVGVDGASLSARRRGWVSVAIDAAGFVRAAFHDDFDDVARTYPGPSVLAVDIPIGLTHSVGRSADAAARAFLGRRAFTIFPAPPRDVLGAATYDEALRNSRAATGKGLSRQAWALVPRIREVHAHRGDLRIREVHPEVAFQCLAGAPLTLSKKTWGGLAERRRLLAEAGIVIPEELGEAAGVGPDDVLDAAAAAWSARRIAAGEACSFPTEPSEHDGPRPIAIWA